MVIGGICAIGSGAIMPVMTIIFGDLTGSFGDLAMGTMNSEEFMNDVEALAM